jgi:hypothetical protein
MSPTIGIDHNLELDPPRARDIDEQNSPLAILIGLALLVVFFGMMLGLLCLPMNLSTMGPEADDLAGASDFVEECWGALSGKQSQRSERN